MGGRVKLALMPSMGKVRVGVDSLESPHLNSPRKGGGDKLLGFGFYAP